MAACLARATVASCSAEIPGPAQTRPVVLKNATIHPVSKDSIERGMLLFDDGVITEIGTTVTVPKGARIIDLTGRHVWPGLIEAHSHTGLVEIPAVRATVDTAESGTLNPNVVAATSVNPDSEVIPVTRAGGVLIALTAPSGGLISGRASVLQLDGWTTEEMTLLKNAALMIRWPEIRPGRDNEHDDPMEESVVDRLRELFEEARAYRKARQADASRQRFDIRLESLGPVIDGDIPVMVTAHNESAIQMSVAFAVEQGLRLIILGGHDAVLCARLLKQHRIPVIVDSVHRVPRRRDEPVETCYTLPGRLQQSGIRFCISGSDRERTWNARNLPFHAGTAVAYGLPEADAIRAITLSAAEILGIDDRVGSLDPGKDATLIVTTGSPLETTSDVTIAWIQGRAVDLNNRHKHLYSKYRTKYAREHSNDK